MRYKICKIIDGNGKIEYQIKKKIWLGWKSVKIYHSICLGRGYYEILSFFTFEQAKDWIDREVGNYNWIKKAKQKRVLECVEL